MKFNYLPLLFFSFSLHAIFTTEDSASINLTGGNTDLKTYDLKTNNSLELNWGTWSIDGDYQYGESNEIRSAENWSLLLKYERKISDKINIFLGELLEADRFSGIRRRYNSDFGFKYILSKNAKREFFTELGYRYTIEKSTNSNIEDKKDNKSRLYSEISQELKKDLRAKFWIEYLPNLSESEDYLINFEPSLIMTLTSILSLKSSYLWNYDNQPASEKGKHDYQYLLTLIAKF